MAQPAVQPPRPMSSPLVSGVESRTLSSSRPASSRRANAPRGHGLERGEGCAIQSTRSSWSSVGRRQARKAAALQAATAICHHWPGARDSRTPLRALAALLSSAADGSAGGVGNLGSAAVASTADRLPAAPRMCSSLLGTVSNCPWVAHRVRRHRQGIAGAPPWAADRYRQRAVSLVTTDACLRTSIGQADGRRAGRGL